MREHPRRAELPRQLRLRLEAGDHTDLDVRVQRAQDRDRGGPECARAVHEHLAVRLRRVAGDGVQGNRERVREHRDLVGDGVGHGEQHGVVRGHERRVATARVLRGP